MPTNLTDFPSTLPPGTREWVEDQQRQMIEWFNAQWAATSLGGYVSKPAIVEFDKHGNIRNRAAIKDWLDTRKTQEGKLVPIMRNDGTIIRKPAAPWWLDNPAHRWYRRVVLAPPGSAVEFDEHERDLNLWNGFKIDPAEGSCERNLAHVAEVICDGDEDMFEWLMNWCAALVQSPGHWGMSAPILIGGQGAGKGHFVLQMLGAFFHQHHVVHLRNGNGLTGSFNEHLSQKILCFADEAFWGDKASANNLKSLITEPTVEIHPKFLPKYEEPSCLHVVIASNADRPLPIERDDRRFAIFRVSDRKKNDQGYFGTLRQELAAGGTNALLHHLLFERNVDEDLLRTPPANNEKASMKLGSLAPLDQFWLSVLVAREAWEPMRSSGDDMPGRGRVSRETLHEEMVAWHKEHQFGGPLPSREMLGNHLSRHFKNGGLPGWPRYTKSKSGANAWLFPPIDTCREVFERATGTSPFQRASDWSREIAPTIH